MNEFVMAYPAIVLALVAILCAAIGGLFSSLLYFVKQSLDNLLAAVDSLREAIQEGHEDIGTLKDRMQRQEAICEMQRANCPTRRIVYPNMAVSSGQHVESPG
jgi:hypothetical protein